MHVRQVAQLVAVGVFAAWILAGYPLPRLADNVDPTITGSTTPRGDGATSGPVRVIVAQAVMPETEPPVDAREEEPPPPPVPQRAREVDESALRYFARQGDLRRLDAEIARLRALYPGWEPPADPTAPEDYSDPETDRLWQLFSDERYAEARSAIAARREQEPGWEAPEALLSLLGEADARVRIVNASDARQWNTVIGSAASMPSLLTCGYVDILWRVAEAFIETDRPGRAMDAYRYILTNCPDEAERLATVQKAMARMPAGDVQSLMEFEQTDEFQPIRDDLLRRRVGAIAETAEGVAEEGDIARLKALAEDATDISAPLILGWYYYRRDDPGAALDWFRIANQRGPTDMKAAEGYTLALIALDRFAEAEAFAFAWNERSDDNLAAYLIAVVDLLAVDPPLRISEAVLERIVNVARRVESVEVAEQLGWYAYNLGQVKTAARWFDTSLKWDPDFEPGAYGLAVCLIALEDRAAANAIIRQWGDRSERIADLTKPVKAELRGPSYAIDAPIFETNAAAAPEPAQRAPSSPGTALSGRDCGGTAPTSTLSPERALRRGWCLMDLNRPVEAALAFEAALRSPDEAVRSDAAYGASLANLRSGVTDKATVAAASASLSADKQEELLVSILTQQAQAAYADGHYAQAIIALDERSRYAQEQIDLLVLRGFAYLKLGHYRDAKRIFQAAAGTGYPDAVRGLAEVQAAQNGFYQ